MPGDKVLAVLVLVLALDGDGVVFGDFHADVFRLKVLDVELGLEFFPAEDNRRLDFLVGQHVPPGPPQPQEVAHVLGKHGVQHFRFEMLAVRRLI